MTVTNMITAVKLGLDYASTLTSPVWFEDDEIVFWLNEAQLQKVKQAAFGTNFRKEAYDDSQKRIDDLQSLIVESGTQSLSSYGASKSNVAYIAIADLEDSNNRYMFYIDSMVDMDTAGWLGADKISYFDATKLIDTTYNKPYIERPFIYFYSDKIGVVYDPDDTANNINVTFIKEPKELVATGAAAYQVTTSELPTETHREITNIAVNMMLEASSSGRIQSNEMQLAKKE